MEHPGDGVLLWVVSLHEDEVIMFTMDRIVEVGDAFFQRHVPQFLADISIRCMVKFARTTYVCRDECGESRLAHYEAIVEVGTAVYISIVENAYAIYHLTRNEEDVGIRLIYHLRLPRRFQFANLAARGIFIDAAAVCDEAFIVRVAGDTAVYARHAISLQRESMGSIEFLEDIVLHEGIIVEEQIEIVGIALLQCFLPSENHAASPVERACSLQDMNVFVRKLIADSFCRTICAAIVRQVNRQSRRIVLR